MMISFLSFFLIQELLAGPLEFIQQTLAPYHGEYRLMKGDPHHCPQGQFSTLIQKDFLVLLIGARFSMNIYASGEKKEQGHCFYDIKTSNEWKENQLEIQKNIDCPATTMDTKIINRLTFDPNKKNLILTIVNTQLKIDSTCLLKKENK